MLKTKFSPWPSFTSEEAEAVKAILLSNKVNYWTGDEGHLFEKEYAHFANSRYAIALANGTVALELALKALEIGPGDEVIVTPRTFLASVSAVVNSGAIPIFADVSLDSQNITAESVIKVLTSRTKAIICVHLSGWPCEMDKLLELAIELDLYLIEDCAQAHGARYQGRPVGSIGDIGCWSFCQDKIMSTGGEGGMVTTNSRELWSKIWSYKDHGKSWEAVYDRKHPPGFHWLHESFGTNGRMTEMQAAIGRIQLGKMAKWKKLRQANSAKIDSVCSKFDSLRVPFVPDHIDHARYKHYAFVRPELLKSNWNRDRIVEEINRKGVPCYQGSCSEVYLEKAFDNTGLRPKKRLPVAKELGKTSLMFLIHPTLTKVEIENTCDAIIKVMDQASI
ncbi:MAG: DegT/DnrJ/EryC1/StrS aminotransferase family protein [Gammaproteobacteria bacterium]|nr:DegT/DnrJ/EryC1/StrS aminotransferase family protein [Gammaproteobacteria bacterium]